jgi:hypothetical protein
MTRPIVLVGCWPRRMSAELAAAYCGEHSVQAFICRVGREYPQPRVREGNGNYGFETISTERSFLRT